MSTPTRRRGALALLVGQHGGGQHAVHAGLQRGRHLEAAVLDALHEQVLDPRVDRVRPLRWGRRVPPCIACINSSNTVTETLYILESFLGLDQR